MTNLGTGTVAEELVAATGGLVGTYAVGSGPMSVAFDGAYIWVVNNGSSNVTKLVAATGALVGTYAVATGPYAVAFDGANIWVAVPNSNLITKL